MSAPNAFGAGLREASPAEVRVLDAGPSAAAAEVARLAALAQGDAALAWASGRWVMGRPDPERYVPGDVVALRSFAISADLMNSARLLDALGAGALQGEAAHTAARRIASSLVDLGALYRAVPHFVDESAAAGLLASQPPGPDVVDGLRLPHPTVAVFLARPLPIAPEACDWPEIWDHHVDVEGRPSGELTCLGQVRQRGGAIEGVVLAEADGGGLDDEVLWLVEAEADPARPGPERFDRQRALVWGRLSAARLAPVATNLAATVAWAEWHEPDRPLGLAGAPGSREWRRSTRSGAFRRHEPKGAAAGVRVLDLGRSLAAQHPAADAPGRSGPVTHLRRAHWRLQPVGPGRSERKVVRVAATVVNAGRSPVSPTVYRVPGPDAGPAQGTASEAADGSAPAVDLRRIDLDLRQRPDATPFPAHRDTAPEVTP
ncbi:MAG TPA: hypothetical protein VFJ85_01930 [Acidimicrobiales bacterium]|nr:hypothetical protein [Acidimicrobiales bacterium]